MRRKIELRQRKEPRQQRSRQMRKDILEAGVRVLRRESALRFTMPRVAEVAGISVGSLYQYFPNKQALLFALHSQTVERSWVEVQHVLGQRSWGARKKIERIARLFFLAESADVRELGAALQELEIQFEDQPEYRAIDGQVHRLFSGLLREALPNASRGRLEFSTQLLITTLESVGKSVARRSLSPRQVARWARECAAMLCEHLELG